jgi:enoyl-CoA hydratase/carnithine racemase
VIQVADIGTLQRLPKLIGTQKASELAYTARTFSGIEAEMMGLVAKSFDSQEEMNQFVDKIATQIANKSPLTIRFVFIFHV